MNTSLDVAHKFISALDKNDADLLSKLIEPSGTWWVDSGHDRAAGVHGNDPGDDRGWPLHATMNIGKKVELLRGIRNRFPTGIRQIRWNSFCYEQYVLVEVDGYGINTLERVYQNRYAFVIEVTENRVKHVREYLDTHHSAYTFTGKGLDRRSRIDDFVKCEPEMIGDKIELGVQFCSVLSSGDSAQLCKISHDDAIWWADSGKDRERGDRSAAIERDPTKFLVGNSLVHDRAMVIPNLRSTFSGGWTLDPSRIFSDGSSICVEASSNGCRIKRDGSTMNYQNRYCFVLTTSEEKISGVREYCDTLHAFDVFGIAP